MTGAVDLVAVWKQWDDAPRAEAATLAKEDAIRALGIDGSRLHDRVAGLRLSGEPLGSAVRRAAAEQGVEG